MIERPEFGAQIAVTAPRLIPASAMLPLRRPCGGGARPETAMAFPAAIAGWDDRPSDAESRAHRL
jgi:hypothetical protein